MVGRTLAICAFGALTVLSLGSAGCAKKAVIPQVVETTSAKMPGKIRVSDELVKLCKLTFDGSVQRAPKFEFDDSEIMAEDREMLAQVARCVTSGPLAGRALGLVGHADPRGELEYNMVLGEHRAESVFTYLALLGVSPEKMAKTSRGELDAAGKDEDGWWADRRVDIGLR